MVVNKKYYEFEDIEECEEYDLNDCDTTCWEDEDEEYIKEMEEDELCDGDYDEDEEELDPLTPEDRVIALLKGGFENRCGISFDEFTRIYHEILENNPEKLI